MLFAPSNKNPVHLQLWFLSLLAAYAVFELSFNHRLLELAGDLRLGEAAVQLNDIEIWGRVVSGLGLALLLMRWLDRFFNSRWLLTILSCALGLTCMWHLQKALVDTIVSRADHADMVMSFQSHLSTQDALQGRIFLRGIVLTDGPALDEIKPVMSALWASSVLGLLPSDVETGSAESERLRGTWVPQLTQKQLQNSYRKTVMTPIILGASLLFGLLNLCQFFAGLSSLLLIAFRQQRFLQQCQSWLLSLLITICLFLSWWPGNAWVSSPAYTQVARPALWTNKPFLAPFVEWSLRAEPAWANPVAWVHRELLQDFQFGNPLRGLTERSNKSMF
jgi:hypothetical protein